MKRKNILACRLCDGNCMGCFYADDCNWYNGIAPYDALMIEETRDENGKVVNRRPTSLCLRKDPISQEVDLVSVWVD